MPIHSRARACVCGQALTNQHPFTSNKIFYIFRLVILHLLEPITSTSTVSATEFNYFLLFANTCRLTRTWSDKRNYSSAFSFSCIFSWHCSFNILLILLNSRRILVQHTDKKCSNYFMEIPLWQIIEIICLGGNYYKKKTDVYKRQHFTLNYLLFLLWLHFLFTISYYCYEQSLLMV